MEAAEKRKVELTDRQKWVLCQLVNGIRKDNILQQTLGGYAGTGKTTSVRYLTKFFPDFAVAAYTGKAANVLRKNGIYATTIHSRIYKPYFENGVTYWDLVPEPGCDGFIIDEASMVSSEIYEDLSTFGLPMIYVGDHGQLEPIDSDFNLMEKPDYTLEEIHRNAGDIARFAEHLRKGYASRGFRGNDGTVEFIHGKNLNDKLITTVDQIICAYNATRVAINKQVREALKRSSQLVNIGERVMCLRNNRKYGLFNGMQGTVIGLREKRNRYYMDFEFDEMIFENVLYDPSYFGKEKYKIKYGPETPNPFDYAYCITAHKAQGDEFDSVLVIEQICRKWSHKRWAYTSASRAKSKLFWKVA